MQLYGGRVPQGQGEDGGPSRNEGVPTVPNNKAPQSRTHVYERNQLLGAQDRGVPN